MVKNIYNKGGENIQWRKDNIFKKWWRKTWIYKYKTMRLEYFLIPNKKINSKWVKDLNVSPETIKLLTEDLDKILSDINCKNICLMSPKAK